MGTLGDSFYLVSLLRETGLGPKANPKQSSLGYRTLAGVLMPKGEKE
jgi:hypothetical protein